MRAVVKGSRVAAGKLIVGFEGIETPEAIGRWRGCSVEVRASELPKLGEDEYYHYQLIGLAVYGADGAYVGRLESIIETGANDVYCVQGPFGEVLVPATKDAIESIDIDAGSMRLADLDGLLPEARKEGRGGSAEGTE